MFKSFVLTAVFGIALFSFAVPHSYAASPEGLQISPAFFNEKAEPGKTYQYSITVTNVSEADKTFYISTKDIKGIDENGQPLFATEGEPTPYDLTSWISVSEDSVKIPAGGDRVVNFSITVPSDASPGSHFGGVFLDILPPRLRETGAGVGVSVGSLMNLQIAGDIVENSRFRSFSTDKLIYDALPVGLDVRLENLGNTLIRPTGFVEIVNMFGNEVASLTINESAAGVFPNSERTFTVVWEETDLPFGRYQAVATVVYGEDVRKTLTAATSFWVLPLVPIASVLGGILLFVLVLYFGIRMHIEKRLREMGVSPGTKSQAALYAQKYKHPLSRTLLSVIGIVIFCVLFLIGLFMMFA